MTRAISLAIAAICGGQSVLALNQVLKDHIATRSEQVDPTDFHDEQWNSELYPIMANLTHWDVFLNDTVPGFPFHEGDEDRKPEKDVVLLTLDDYDKIFFGPTPNKQKWFIAILADDTTEWSACKDTLSVLRVLANERDPDWRFGMFLRSTADGQSFVRMTDTYSLPNTFIFEPNEETGVTEIWEGPAMIQYEGFIRWMDRIVMSDGGWFKDFRSRLTFKPAYPVPVSFKQGSLRWWWSEYHREFHLWMLHDGAAELIYFCRNNYIGERSIDQMYGVEDYVNAIHPMDRTLIGEKIIAGLALAALVMLISFLCCIKYCCCSSKKPVNVAKVDTTVKGRNNREKLE